MPESLPTAADLAAIARDKVHLIDGLLTVIEQQIVPLTEQGVRGGNKVFGAAILKKADLSTVAAATNDETRNPLNHGEMMAIDTFYALPERERPAARDCIFLATHQPCSLCLSGITWSGFDNFFYLFSYEDTKQAFAIPYDLRILDQVFRCPDGSYAPKNEFWSSWGLQQLIAECGMGDRQRFNERVEALRKKYAEMSAVYQQSKDQQSDIQLK